MAHFVERRASPRCDAVKNQSRLEYVTPEGTRTAGARLINISRDGALVAADYTPSFYEPIRTRIESPVKTDWVDAVTVRIHQSGEIVIRFPKGCPDDLLLAGTVGINLLSMLSGGASAASTFD